MKRCLVICNNMGIGGAETFLMKLYRTLDKKEYQMDFCLNDRFSGDYTDEILKMGGKVFVINGKLKNPFQFYHQLSTIVRSNNYTNVLRVSENSLAALELVCSKRAGAKNLVYRSSNSKSDSRLVTMLHYAFRWIFRLHNIVMLAPSEQAGKYTFGNKLYRNGKVILLNNGLAVEQYRYNQEYRDEIRRTLNIQDDFLLGHVGRFVPQKNHMFILEILEKLTEKGIKYKMLFLGDGPMISQVKERAKELEILDHCLFLGNVQHVNKYLSALDGLVFPSLYEGMPNVVIEAQVSGLPCLIADTISKDVNITHLVSFLSIKDKREWVDKIQKLKEMTFVDREKYADMMLSNGYDITSVTDKFKELMFK